MKLSLNIQIFIGAVVGVLLGIVFNILGDTHPLYSSFILSAEIIGKVFIDLLKMIVLPLVFTSITIGIANLKAHHQMNKVWKVTLLYSLSTTSLAASIGLLAMNIFKPGVGVKIDLFKDQMGTFNAEKMTLFQFIKTFLSGVFVNPVSAMASGNILAIVVFAIFLGIAIIVSADKSKNVLNLFNELFNIIMVIVGWIIKVAPVGVAALLFKLVATQSLSLFQSLGLYMGVVVGTTLFHGVVVLPTVLYLFTKISPVKFFKAMQEAFITAFSTSSSSATLPVSLRCVEQNLKVDKNIAGFVLPLGATVNMDGTALYEAAAALFVANLIGVQLHLIQQIVVVLLSVISSIGAPGIPSAGMVTMIMVLQAVGLPVEAIAILLPIDRPLDTIRTVVNVEGDAVCSAIVQKLTT